MVASWSRKSHGYPNLLIWSFGWWPGWWSMWHYFDRRGNVAWHVRKTRSLTQSSIRQCLWRCFFHISSWAECRGKRRCQETPLLEKPSVVQYQKYHFQSHKWITPGWNARKLPEKFWGCLWMSLEYLFETKQQTRHLLSQINLQWKNHDNNVCCPDLEVPHVQT